MSERQFLDRVRERIESPERRSGLTVTYAVGGGAPSETIEERIQVSGTGEVRLAISDELNRRPVGEASGTVSEEELEELLEAFGASLEELVPRSEASFLPDATVGSITFEIDGEQETFYFDAEETYERAGIEREEVTAVPEPAVELPQAPLDHIVHRIDRLERQLLEGDR